MGYLVYYECIGDNCGWSKKGMVNRIFFKEEYTERKAEACTPLGWKIIKVEEIPFPPDGPLYKGYKQSLSSQGR